MQLILGGRTHDLRRRVLVMAIVNRTADSFYDGGRTLGLEAALDHALAQADAGADIIDVGAVKAGPGAEVSIAEEVERIVEFTEAFHARSAVPVSVDTYRAAVAEAALGAGATMINDVGGLHEPEIADVVAAHPGAALVVVHTGGLPRTRPWRPVYHPDVVRAVAAGLREQVAQAQARGVPAERIVVDPGHDLGKNTFQSLELCRRLSELDVLGRPVLVALSRKDFLGETLGVAPADRLEASLAAAVVTVLGGARILRVHDTEATVRALRTVEAIQGWRRPAAAARGLE